MLRQTLKSGECILFVTHGRKTGQEGHKNISPDYTPADGVTGGGVMMNPIPVPLGVKLTPTEMMRPGTLSISSLFSPGALVVLSTPTTFLSSPNSGVFPPCMSADLESARSASALAAAPAGDIPLGSEVDPPGFVSMEAEDERDLRSSALSSRGVVNLGVSAHHMQTPSGKAS